MTTNDRERERLAGVLNRFGDTYLPSEGNGNVRAMHENAHRIADLLEADAVERDALRSALKGLSDMYSHAWDLSDGSGLVMLAGSVPMFEAAHAKAKKLLAPRADDKENAK